ncbi:MAG: CoA-binding protein [Candidatus Micrarchaeota archaeon]
MQSIPQILKSAKVIAVVGLSDKPDRPSYGVASYLLNHGYRIIPVNPNISEWKGILAKASLLEITEPVDIVDIFRKSEDVLPIVEQAIKIKPKLIWMQLGVINEEAAKLAEANRILVIMDKCIKIVLES